MTGRLLSLTLATLVSLLPAARATAQGLERVPAPIDVRVTAASSAGVSSGAVLLVPQGAKVSISGTTVPLGAKGTQVRIEIKPPSAARVTLTAPIAADRSWAATFPATNAPGKYGVTAFTADLENSATTSFIVLTDADIDGLADLLESSLSKGAAEAASAIGSAQASLAAKGPFPNQDTVTKNLAEVTSALQELPGRLKKARAGLATLGQIATKYPAGASELEPTQGMGSASEGLVDFVKKPQNLLLDAAQMLTGLAFDALCEKFTGPVSGTFAVDATINGGQKFWGYTTIISGKVTLMYEKQLAKPGEPIPMTGEIEGNGFFKMYEDLMAFNNFNRQFVIYRALIPPIGTGGAAQGAIDPLGKAARMATPGYFRVPVKGRLVGNELTITVGDAAYNDFSDAVKGRAVYVVLAPAAPIPYTMMSNIPVQKAQFILSRGLRTTAVLPVATATHGKTIIKTAAGTFNRKEVVSNGEVTVTWKLDVKACNPDCQ